MPISKIRPKVCCTNVVVLGVTASVEGIVLLLYGAKWNETFEKLS